MNKTILIIDDDEMLRNALGKGLRDEGFNVLTSESAEHADEVLARLSPDAIVLDRMMIGMDGLTFLRKIRGNGTATPVIMLTAMTGAENTIAGLADGANDYLAKPFQMRELVLRLNNILRQSTGYNTKMPNGLTFIDNEFFVSDPSLPNTPAKILALSGEEKKLLQHLTHPMGNIAPAAPMVAKRLRNKINIVLSNLDIITIRGRGYKLVDTTNHPQNKDGNKE
ncbi:MAG: response regulator transcription factor [Alphaproteobacteria bacterium]|nr:response regulator transcription factor [Alphaproteobacteria bacterium]